MGFRVPLSFFSDDLALLRVFFCDDFDLLDGVLFDIEDECERRRNKHKEKEQVRFKQEKH